MAFATRPASDAERPMPTLMPILTKTFDVLLVATIFTLFT